MESFRDRAIKCLSNKNEIRFRPMGESDKDILLWWNQDPNTRRYFRNPKPPTVDEHERWFYSKINDPNSVVFIINIGLGKVGSIRLDLNKEEKVEISLTIAPTARSRGVGKRVMKYLVSAMNDNFVAEILPENQASIKVFTEAGFKPAQGNWYSYP